MTTTYLFLMLLALLAANLPWFSERLFYLWPLRRKHMGWRLLELVVLYFAVGAIGLLAEYRVAGQLAQQHWEFYAITACLFLVFAFPGFVYRVLWKQK